MSCGRGEAQSRSGTGKTTPAVTLAGEVIRNARAA